MICLPWVSLLCRVYPSSPRQVLTAGPEPPREIPQGPDSRRYFSMIPPQAWFGSRTVSLKPAARMSSMTCWACVWSRVSMVIPSRAALADRSSAKRPWETSRILAPNSAQMPAIARNDPGRSGSSIDKVKIWPMRIKLRMSTDDSMRASILPPERTRPTFRPLNRCGYSSSAASGAAPAPSATVFAIVA